jgi:predicted anti-sigma-YlaC factor YlaD
MSAVAESRNQKMECVEAREAISALLDDEEPITDPVELSAHVADCHECSVWRERAHTVTRRARLAPAQPAPTADQALLTAIRVQAGARSTGWPSLHTGIRIGLVLTAIAQIVIVTLPALIFGPDRGTPMHVAHEMGSFDLAIALGFLVVAWQPGRARGMHLLVAAAALLLTVTAVVDLAAGRTSLSDEAPHVLVLAGWVLMYRLAAEAPLGADSGRARWPVPRRRGDVTGRGIRSWESDSEQDTGAATVERRVAGA